MDDHVPFLRFAFWMTLGMGLVGSIALFATGEYMLWSRASGESYIGAILLIAGCAVVLGAGGLATLIYSLLHGAGVCIDPVQKL